MDKDTTDSTLLWGGFGNGTQTASGITLELILGIKTCFCNDARIRSILMLESAKVERQSWVGDVCRKPTGPLQNVEGELTTAVHHSGDGKREGFNSPGGKNQKAMGLRSSDVGSVDTEAH